MILLLLFVALLSLILSEDAVGDGGAIIFIHPSWSFSLLSSPFVAGGTKASHILSVYWRWHRIA